MHALAAVPEAERHGPVAVDDAGNPFQRRYYNAVYRELAGACSIPNGVWNMKARHGRATEARQSGVLLEDASEHLQHSNIQTTKRHYITPSVETTRRLADARVANRKEPADQQASMGMPFTRKQNRKPEFPTSTVKYWRARRDSNSRPPDS